MKDSITPSTNPSERTCPRCDGYGEISPDIMCPLCEGYGTIEQLPDATPSKEAKHTPEQERWYCAKCGATLMLKKNAVVNDESNLRCSKCFKEDQGEVDKLQKFKDYVHKRLDDAGIEKEPKGEHSKAGCRIGDRLDIVLDRITEIDDLLELVPENERLRERNRVLEELADAHLKDLYKYAGDHEVMSHIHGWRISEEQTNKFKQHREKWAAITGADAKWEHRFIDGPDTSWHPGRLTNLDMNVKLVYEERMGNESKTPNEE